MRREERGEERESLCERGEVNRVEIGREKKGDCRGMYQERERERERERDRTVCQLAVCDSSGCTSWGHRSTQQELREREREREK